MQIIINNTPIEVIIKRKKIKNMYLRLKSDLKLYITCHPLVGENQIKKMIKTHEAFITKSFMQISKKTPTNLYRCLGEEYHVIIDSNVSKVYMDDKNIYGKSMLEIEKYYLKECKKFLSVRFNRCCNLFDDLPDVVLKFRHMTSRWGVNNVSKGIITLNTQMYKHDISLIDYIIIHELCHFRQANHSPKFWEEVSKYYPQYKMARKLLREGNI